MKNRKVPERKCIATNEMKQKKDLIRVVRNKEGEVSVDPTGKKNGRGAYVSLDLKAIEKVEKENILEKHLNHAIPPQIYEELRELAGKSANEK